MIFLQAWLGLFTSESRVLTSGTHYLRIVAPTYGAIGVGMTLYFASQGAKRLVWPVLAVTVRMTVAAFIGWLAVVWLGANLSTLFQIVALGTILYAVITSAAVLGGAWGRHLKNSSGLQTDHSGSERGLV
jgi:Na+-driven multidrug efflux pump